MDVATDPETQIHIKCRTSLRLKVEELARAEDRSLSAQARVMLEEAMTARERLRAPNRKAPSGTL